jgi:hypothetical protein
MAEANSKRSRTLALRMLAVYAALCLSFAPAPALDDPPPSDPTPPGIIPNVACPIPGNPPWCRARITLSWTVSDLESSISSRTGCDRILLLDDTPAEGLSFTCTATSLGGTTSQSIILYQDRYGPDLDLSELRSSYWRFLNQTVAPYFICSDAGSGFVSTGGPTAVGPNGVDCIGPAIFDTGTPGIHNYGIVQGTDVAGNSNANWGVTYRVIDDPTGSFPYVFPRAREAEAGRAIAIRFTLDGDRGLGVFRGGTPSVEPIDCATGDSLGPSEAIPPARIDLIYHADLDTYILAWKTDAGWADTCRRLLLGFSDGTDRAIEFQLR